MKNKNGKPMAIGRSKRHAGNLRKHPRPTPWEISRKFAYFPVTGEIVTKGGGVGHHSVDGYIMVQYSQHPPMKIPAHQVAFVLMRGYWPHLINHINGDKSDNRWQNLEEVTNRENIVLARLNHCPSKGITNEKSLYIVNVCRNRRRKKVCFTLWRDAYAWNEKLMQGMRRYGPQYMPPIPSKIERINPHMRSKVKNHD